MRCCYYLLEENRRYVLAFLLCQCQCFFFGTGQFISTIPTKIIIKLFQIFFLAQCPSTVWTYKKLFFLTTDCPATAWTCVKFFKSHNYPPMISASLFNCSKIGFSFILHSYGFATCSGNCFLFQRSQPTTN